MKVMSEPKEQIPQRLFPKGRLSTFWVIIYAILFFFYAILLTLQYSTLVFILAGITAALAITGLLLFYKYHHYKMTRIFKYVLVGTAIFVMVFSSLGIYLSNFSGPIVPKVSFPSFLNASLTPYIQDLEQSTAFRFLQAEHFGTLSFEYFNVHTIYSNAPGGVEWGFYAGDVDGLFIIGQSGGLPYSYDLVDVYGASPLKGYPSNQEFIKSFNEIDSLGLNWFYNQCVSEYQNATGSKPIITDLTISVIFDIFGNYHGPTLIMGGLKAGLDNFGNKIYPAVFEVNFQPNGNILLSNNSPGL